MPRKTNNQVSDTGLSQLKESINKYPRPEVRQRATAIQLLHLGHCSKTFFLIIVGKN